MTKEKQNMFPMPANAEYHRNALKIILDQPKERQDKKKLQEHLNVMYSVWEAEFHNNPATRLPLGGLLK